MFAEHKNSNKQSIKYDAQSLPVKFEVSLYSNISELFSSVQISNYSTYKKALLHKTNVIKCENTKCTTMKPHKVWCHHTTEVYISSTGLNYIAT